MDASQIIDGLLVSMTMREVVKKHCHLDVAQEYLEKDLYVLRALTFMKDQNENKSTSITLANQDWYKRLDNTKPGWNKDIL